MTLFSMSLLVVVRLDRVYIHAQSAVDRQQVARYDNGWSSLFTSFSVGCHSAIHAQCQYT